MSKISVTTIAGLTSGGDANKVKIDSSNTFHVPGHAAVGADVVDATRALTVVGASDGSGSSIIVGYNSSLASKFSVRDDGFTTVGNGLNLADGNLSLASGHGIDFSANTAAAGMTSELLDDYEEGNFTPTFSNGISSATYSSQIGRYTKIGNMVLFSIHLRANGGTANSGHVTITGLPFTANSSLNQEGAWFTYNGGFYNSSSATGAWLVLGGSTSMAFYRQTDGAALAGTSSGLATNLNADCRVAGFYRI